MAASEPTRQIFAQSCADFLKTYPQFDGIDIDWEHPVSGGLQPGSPADARNYVLLLDALRKSIGAGKLLTVAASASPRGIDPIDYADMAGILDWVNVMTYEFHSGGTRAGFNSALYNHDDPSNTRLNLHDAVQAIVTKGIPRTKLVAGVPFRVLIAVLATDVAPHAERPNFDRHNRHPRFGVRCTFRAA